MSTLKDVAEYAGVSTATVSLALNNGPVAAKTRLRVQEAARALKYVPNAIGRSLTTGRTHTLLLVTMISESHADTVRKTSLFHYILEGFLSTATARGYGVRFDVKSHDDLSAAAYFEELVGGATVDGVAVIPQFSRDGDLLAPLKREKFPHVVLRPGRFGTEDNFVDMGNYAGADMVAKLFAAAGAKRIAFINGPPTHFDALERERGFRDGLAVAKPEVIKVWYGDYTIEGGYVGMSEILRGMRPDSVFCANDYMAAGAIRRLLEAGIRVPDDVSVVGYDDNDVCTGLFPPLTSVNNHFFDLGNALAESLLAQIDGHPLARQQTLVPHLVERQSHRAPLSALRQKSR